MRLIVELDVIVMMWKENMEMKVVNVDFVENKMVELDVVQIGSN